MNIHSKQVLFSSLVIVLVFSLSFGAYVPARAAGLRSLSNGCSDPSDSCWRSGFHAPGVEGNIYAMVEDS